MKPRPPGTQPRVAVMVALAVVLMLLAMTAVLGFLARGANQVQAPSQKPHVQPSQPASPVDATPMVQKPVEPPAALTPAGLDAGATPPPKRGQIVLPLSASLEKKRAAATGLRTRAAALFKQKQFRVALPLYEVAVQLDPDSPEGAERLGATYARSGEATRAVYFYNRFLELAPNDPLANDLREDVDSWLKDNPDPALELLREGVMRPLTQGEADLQTELARRMTNTSDPDADLDWFLAELARRRDAGM